jgi:murein DD-endopeptidase MepM/ murein hydrolase activator NlpD
MPETTGKRRFAAVLAITTSLGMMTAAGTLNAVWAAPNTQIIRPPQKAKAAQPHAKPAAKRPPSSSHAKRVTVRNAAALRAPPLPVTAPADEAKPFAIDPARPLSDQLVAVGITRGDAEAAERAATAALKGQKFTVGNTGRASLVAEGNGHQLQSLQIFGTGGMMADIERAPDGTFAAKGVTVVRNQPTTKQGAEPSGREETEGDPRTWRPAEGQSPVVARSARNVAQSTAGLRRVSANGNANIALAKAGVDSETAQQAALALAAVAPPTLDQRSASIELVHGRGADGQIRLVTATIYDRYSRGQVWWFAPKAQPEGFFDQYGNRLGDSGMTMPIEGSHISSPFGTRRWGRWAAFHNGIDIAGQYGVPIIAAADGTVDHAGWYYNYGKTVRIVHSNSLMTSYSHMSRVAAGISPGTLVHKGQVIGYVGSTGRSTGPHLHFCVIVDGHFVNPAPYVSNGGGRLGPQDLVSFREWQRTTAGMARSAPKDQTAAQFGDHNRL